MSTNDPVAVRLLNGISLRQVSFVVTLAQTRNFSRAAEIVAVSQPALSAAVRSVENQLGVRLFDRTTHRVTLTDAGRAVLPHAQRLLTTADHAFADMREVARRETATVRVGVIPSMMAVVAAQVAALQSDAGDIGVHLGDGTSDRLVSQLHAGAYDIIVGVAVDDEDGLVSLPLFDDDLLAVARADSRLARATTLPWAALATEEIVHFSGGSIGELARAGLRANNLSPSRRFHAEQVTSLFGLVRAGLAVGVMPNLYVIGHDTTGLALPSLIRPRVRRRLTLMHRAALQNEHPTGTDFARALAYALKASAGVPARAR